MVTALAGVPVHTPNGAPPPLPAVPPVAFAVPPLPPRPPPPASVPALPAAEPPALAPALATVPPTPAAAGAMPPPLWPTAATLPPAPATAPGVTAALPPVPAVGLACSGPAAVSPQPTSRTHAKPQVVRAPNAEDFTSGRLPRP